MGRPTARSWSRTSYRARAVPGRTAAGTTLVKPFANFDTFINGYAFGTNVSFVIQVNDTIFFTANDGSNGPEL
jgi:hypothetical protein